jgi:hypothetical protein
VGGTVGYWHIAATQHFGRFRSEGDIDLQQKLLEENPRRPTGRAGGEGVGTERAAGLNGAPDKAAVVYQNAQHHRLVARPRRRHGE